MPLQLIILAAETDPSRDAKTVQTFLTADDLLTLEGDEKIAYFDGGKTRIGDLTDGEDSHDGYPGGFPSSTEVHGTRDDDDIDHFAVGIAQEIYGFAGNDTIWAGTSDDSIFGGIGDDEIYGGEGDDLVVGQDGDDFLFGDAGNDSLHAGDGADGLYGFGGNDWIFLTDDGDVDTIYFNVGDDADVIDNFEHGVDKVYLANLGVSAFGDLTIVYNADGTQAQIDFGGGDMLTFTGLEQALEAGDFLF
ncbi:hypothetical protein HKCCE3408_07330 [Rhodobacterales bacterium HKCCE3408]|nr:hypothetical protein [Rhodobacterales bacterium HKCCE3408]